MEKDKNEAHLNPFKHPLSFLKFDIAKLRRSIRKTPTNLRSQTKLRSNYMSPTAESESDSDHPNSTTSQFPEYVDTFAQPTEERRLPVSKINSTSRFTRFVDDDGQSAASQIGPTPRIRRFTRTTIQRPPTPYPQVPREDSAIRFPVDTNTTTHIQSQTFSRPVRTRVPASGTRYSSSFGQANNPFQNQPSSPTTRPRQDNPHISRPRGLLDPTQASNAQYTPSSNLLRGVSRPLSPTSRPPPPQRGPASPAPDGFQNTIQVPCTPYCHYYHPGTISLPPSARVPSPDGQRGQRRSWYDVRDIEVLLLGLILLLTFKLWNDVSRKETVALFVRS